MRRIKHFFKEFREGLKDFGENISIIVNTILLSLIYLIGVGLTSMIAKIVKKKFLHIKEPKKESYWTDLNLKKNKREEYYKQF